MGNDDAVNPDAGAERVELDHYPPPRRLAAAEDKTVLAALASALRHAELIKGKLRALMTSQNRHGDLQAILSACRNCAADVVVLIDDEEGSERAGDPTKAPAPRIEPLQTGTRIA